MKAGCTAGTGASGVNKEQSVHLERASNMSACPMVFNCEVIQKMNIALISVRLGQLLATKIYCEMADVPCVGASHGLRRTGVSTSLVLSTVRPLRVFDTPLLPPRGVEPSR